MLSKEEIECIKQDLELIRDTKSSGTYTSYKIDQAIEYIEQLENKIKELEKPDWEVLCEECSSMAKQAGLTKEDSRRILEEYRTMERKAMKYDTLIQERDYYKARYNEFNDYFLKNNMTIEQMLKELKRSKLYERSTEDDIQSKEDTGTNKLCRRTLDRERTEHSKNDNI